VGRDVRALQEAEDHARAAGTRAPSTTSTPLQLPPRLSALTYPSVRALTTTPVSANAGPSPDHNDSCIKV
jgi:hypothetical protein